MGVTFYGRYLFVLFLQSVNASIGITINRKDRCVLFKVNIENIRIGFYVSEQTMAPIETVEELQDQSPDDAPVTDRLLTLCHQKPIICNKKQFSICLQNHR